MKNNIYSKPIVFSLNTQLRDALFISKTSKSLVVLESSSNLKSSFLTLTKLHKLDPYKVMRKLVSVYLAVRKSSSENPYKGLRALLRIWIGRTNTGNLQGFERCGWSA